MRLGMLRTTTVFRLSSDHKRRHKAAGLPGDGCATPYRIATEGRCPYIRSGPVI
jgi:hypothetical protein